MTKQRDPISRTILERLKAHGQNQQDVADIFKRTRAWASQEFFGEPERTIRRLFVHQPDALNDMARIAGWENAPHNDDRTRDHAIRIFGETTQEF